MPLVTLNEILQDAEKGGYAVGAFNCNNMEIVQAITAAAEEENAPVIIQASQGAIKYAGLQYIRSLVEIAADNIKTPVVLHLDHGTNFEQVVRCVRYGFTSIMIDGSKLPLEENIALTNKVSEICRASGLSVEAELGRIGGTEDDISVEDWQASMTDPEEAKYFVESTDIDALAVAIGTAHGQYKGTPQLDFERLEKIRSLVQTPIVLHGSSGVPDEDIKKAVELGVRKINIDTEIRESFVRRSREVMEENPKEIDPRKILGPAREEMIKTIREKIRIFGSSNKA